MPPPPSRLGKKFYVWTDNTTSQAAVRKRKSKDEQVNEEWKEVQRLLTQLECDIEAKRVASKDNTADALSRGLRGDLTWYEEVKIMIPPDLELLISQVFPPSSSNNDDQTERTTESHQPLRRVQKECVRGGFIGK